MALCVSTPKSTILLIVDATELLICVIINTPKKLNTALIIIAFRGLKHRVVTQVAIAFGASVQPFTKITPNVNNTVISNIGFSKIQIGRASCREREYNKGLEVCMRRNH